MRCPFCGAQDTKVIDSRLSGEGDQVRRRRECLSCGERFTTYESAELNLPRVIKQDGSRVPFDGRKLASGMMRALEKRPVSTERIDAALDRIEEGGYGVCVECEKKLQTGRLDAVPWARHCIDCQELQDRGEI